MKVSTPKVSVIIPMYNTERFLPECLDSVLDQSLVDIEIILINDESPDRCIEIADNYAQKDSRIRVISQRNGGLASARNTGLKNATGDYICFIDSDDWIKQDMFECMYNMLSCSGSDICISGIQMVNSEKGIIESICPEFEANYLGEEIQLICQCFYGEPLNKGGRNKFAQSVCTCMYKRSFLEDNDLRFTNCKSEDSMFNIRAFRQAKSVSVIPECFYNYRKDGQESLTSQFSHEQIEQFSQRYKLLKKEAQKEPEGFREECLKRSVRWGFDIARILIGRIEQSQTTFGEKRRLVNEVLSMNYSEEALAYLSQNDLVFKHRLFFMAMQRKWPSILLAMVGGQSMMQRINLRKE